MPKIDVRIFVKSILSLAIAMLVVAELTGSHRAQGSRNRPPTEIVTRSTEQDMLSREWNLTHIPDEVNKQFKKEQVSLFPQVEEDFTRIQVVNNDLMKAVFINKKVDYGVISEAAGEIRKRALRLRQNLILPELPVSKRSQQYPQKFSDEQLRVSLL